MGYKIEIVLISIAIVLLGIICCVSVFHDEALDELKIIRADDVTIDKTTLNVKDSVTDSNTDKVDLNSASQEELTELDGIGEVLAKRIIEYRKLYGFNSPEDILNVDGIGEKKYQTIKDKITAE